jgi:hypothetical protein
MMSVAQRGRIAALLLLLTPTISGLWYIQMTMADTRMWQQFVVIQPRQMMMTKLEQRRKFIAHQKTVSPVGTLYDRSIRRLTMMTVLVVPGRLDRMDLQWWQGIASPNIQQHMVVKTAQHHQFCLTLVETALCIHSYRWLQIDRMKL